MISTRGKTDDGRRLAVLFVPSEGERIRIVIELLRLQALPNRPFEAVWYINERLKVRRTHFEEPWILPWIDARELVDRPAPKPAVIERPKLLQKRKRA